jgi:hypothetical protein
MNTVYIRRFGLVTDEYRESDLTLIRLIYLLVRPRH